MRPILSPSVSSSGPTAERRDHQAQRLREGDGAVLRGREMKAVREVGQDGAQHGGNHSVDEDGEDGGEDQHRRSVSFRTLVRRPCACLSRDAAQRRSTQDGPLESVGKHTASPCGFVTKRPQPGLLLVGDSRL